MYYIYVNNHDASCTIFYDTKPEELEPIYELESLPEGDGILKRADDGTFYYEQLSEVEIPDPIEPEIEETIEQRLERIEQTTAYTQLQVEYLTMLSEVNTTK